MLGLRLLVCALPSLTMLFARFVVSKTRIMLLSYVVLLHIRCTALRKVFIFGVYAGCMNRLWNMLLAMAVTACSPDGLSVLGAVSSGTTLPALRIGLHARSRKLSRLPPWKLLACNQWILLMLLRSGVGTKLAGQ